MRELMRNLRENSGAWPEWTIDPSLGSGPLDIPDSWEVYVRRFCLLKNLDAQQLEGAYAVLRSCRTAAIPHVTKIRSSQKSGVLSHERRQKLVEAQGPKIEEIFSERSVPRLNGLLTSAQKATNRSPVSPNEVVNGRNQSRSTRQNAKGSGRPSGGG